jgi:hypothetical protein
VAADEGTGADRRAGDVEATAGGCAGLGLAWLLAAVVIMAAMLGLTAACYWVARLVG